MSNDLISNGGGIAPYVPASGGLPASSTPLGGGVDYDNSSNQNQIRVFGNVLPPGTNAHHVEAVLSQLCAVAENDLKQLGASSHFINEAIAVFKQLAHSPVPQETPTHGYDLSNLLPIPASDAPYVIAFLNQMRRDNADQEDCRKAVYWLGLLYQAQANPQTQPQQTKNTTAISEAEFKHIAKNNDQALSAGEAALKVKWGNQYQANIAIVKRYMAGLPAQEREFLETAVIGDRMALNCPEVILDLFQHAISAVKVPGSSMTAGNSLQDEKAAIEQMMRTNRRAYNANPAIAARYREIIDLIGG